MAKRISFCDDRAYIYGEITNETKPLDIWRFLQDMRGLAENDGRAWLVWDDGTNLEVKPPTDELIDMNNDKNGKESSHRLGNSAWRHHSVTINSFNDGERGWMMMDIDNAKAFVDDFNGAVEADGLNPDSLDMYFEIEPEQARKLGEALIAHADNATFDL